MSSPQAQVDSRHCFPSLLNQLRMENSLALKKVIVSASNNNAKTRWKEHFSPQRPSLHYWELEYMAGALREAENKGVAQAWEISKLQLMVKMLQNEKLESTLLDDGGLQRKYNASKLLLIKERKQKVAAEQRAAGHFRMLQQAEERVKDLQASLLEANANLDMAESKRAEIERRATCLQQSVDSAEHRQLADHKRLKETQEEVLRLQSLVDEEQRNRFSETEKLKFDNDLVSSKQTKEVDLLKRERNFVWDQMKRMEETYAGRLKVKSEQLHTARQEIERLRQVILDVQSVKDRTDLEATVLRVELKQSEDEVHQLKQKLTGLDMTVGPSQVEAENIPQLNLVLQTRRQANIASLPDQPNAPQSRKPDEESASKPEELRKRMDELRQENANLRLLYGELEAAFQDKQRQERAPNVGHKDTTSRNLKAELEAAAADQVRNTSVANKEVVSEHEKGRKTRSHTKGSHDVLRQPLQDAGASLNIPVASQTRARKRLPIADEDSGRVKKSKTSTPITSENVSPPTTTAHCCEELENALGADKSSKFVVDENGSSTLSCSSFIVGKKKGRKVNEDKRNSSSRKTRKKPLVSHHSDMSSPVKELKGLSARAQATPVLHDGEVPLPTVLSRSVEPTRSGEPHRPLKTRFFSSAFSIPKVVLKDGGPVSSVH